MTEDELRSWEAALRDWADPIIRARINARLADLLNLRASVPGMTGEQFLAWAERIAKGAS